MVLSWLFRTLGLKKAARHKTASPPRARLCLETLEDRAVPAITFNVNTLADTGDKMIGDGNALDAQGNTSLRAALEEGENLGDLNVTVNLAGVSGTIFLGTVLPDLTKNYTISGPGSINLIIARAGGAPDFRFFNLDTPER